MTDPTEAVLLDANPAWGPLSDAALAAIRASVATAPPLTDTQRQRLTVLLGAERDGEPNHYGETGGTPWHSSASITARDTDTCSTDAASTA